ncbi:MAG: nucleotide exchange factor GrpE [Spirochaetaceae bacterium]|nr:MAG: nucleotide exchange factor GrpE [Spirochaetaceae bacterium]
MSEKEAKTDHSESKGNGGFVEEDQVEKAEQAVDQGSEAAIEADLGERTQQLEEQIKELNDQLLRKAAEFDNFRKRIFREKEESIKYANAALLNDVLPIIDDFERAIQSAADSKDFNAFHTGVSMIEKQMVSMLERNWGLKRFSANGELFDPEKHEAIAVEETDQHDTEIVLEDYQKGYLLHDRVLRPAKVKVARPVAPDQADGNEEQEKE